MMTIATLLWYQGIVLKYQVYCWGGCTGLDLFFASSSLVANDCGIGLGLHSTSSLVLVGQS